MDGGEQSEGELDDGVAVVVAVAVVRMDDDDGYDVLLACRR